MFLSHYIRQKPYEHIVLTVRRHLVTFVPYVILAAVLLAVPILIRWLIFLQFPELLDSTIWLPVITLGASLYYLSATLFIYAFFVDFYLDVLVVTNDRLIDIEQQNLFARTVSEIDLYQIQDATSEVKGFLATIFNYGDVHVETAGQAPKFIAHNVPHPHELRRAILDLAAVDKHYHTK